MSAVAGSESAPGPRRGWQVSLSGLILLVLAAGLAAGLARSAREVWGVRIIQTAPSSSSSQVPMERLAGLLLEVTGVCLIVILCRVATGLYRGLRSGGPMRRGPALWAIAWRAAAAGFLLWFVAQESRVLRLDFENEMELARLIPGWGSGYRVRQGLFPICALLAMLGLALGMGAGSILEEPPRLRRRPYWLFVPLACAVSLLIVAQTAWPSVIPYIVLVAIEAVTNAMQHRLAPGPGLSARLLRAGVDASAAVAIGLTLSIVVARDFERARRREPWATSPPGRFLRFVLLMATAAAGIYIARVTIPAIHPFFAQGFRQILGRGEVCMIVAGFGIFALGLAARAVVQAPAREKPRWLTLLSAAVRYTVLGLVLLSVSRNLPSTMQLEPGLPAWLTLTIDAAQQGLTQIWSRFPGPFAAVVFQWLAIEWFLWILMTLGLAVLVLELAIQPKGAAFFSPFDALASRRNAYPVLWLATALLVVCLVALPTLIVAGQVLLHLRLSAADLMRYGWPS